MLNDMWKLLNSSSLNGANQTFVENLFELYQQNPEQVGDDWKKFFAAMQQEGHGVSNFQTKKYFENFHHDKVSHHTESSAASEFNVQNLINAYRLLGHLIADVNPLKFAQKKSTSYIKELDLSFHSLDKIRLEQKFAIKNFCNGNNLSLYDILQVLNKCYAQKIAVEYLHIVNEDERNFIQSKVEQEYFGLNYSVNEQKNILQLLNSAENLEKYLASKYPGATRFGLEGCDSLLVAIDAILCTGNANGLKEVTLGMNHRGRLNVIVNLLGKVPGELFSEFEGKHHEELESGDVKYHQGFSSNIKTNSGELHLSLMYNPSHLEIVTPVVSGSVRARQARRANNMSEVLAINVHGDAAFAGQGVVMETLNMSQCPGFKIGGSIHIITNNQIGFTTDKPEDARSTTYCTDIGKMLMIPIFHVNADCPESVAFVSKLAFEYRHKFNRDVIIDIIGYRRFGHNEADEPAATQPLMYNFIKQHPTVFTIYQQQLIKQNILTASDVNKIKDDYRQFLDQREQTVTKYHINPQTQAVDWKIYAVNDWRTPFNSELPLEVIEQLANIRDKIPDGFKLHSRVEKIIADRKMMTKNQIPLDWGFGETLAYATLLNDGYNVRLSGQDCARGTFFHRHVVWYDQQNGAEYISLNNLHEKQGKFEIVNSILSEEAVLGFEYGFSTTEPRTLTIWEAQFGDFANGAQVVIDQFISSGEQKWGRLSGLVMLLPHGYEGQGPEHSSARLERYMQLCAQNNIQVCIPSTPAQIYHLLRRQLLRPVRKPLIVITPKSLLRHKRAISTLNDLQVGSFTPVIDDHDVSKDTVTRLIMCSGKIYYELLEEREKDHNPSIAIIRIEQLYPFPLEELASVLKEYSKVTTIVWCQEEPENQGAWYSSKHNFEAVLKTEQKLIYAGRAASAAPAVGYSSLHQQQQQQLLIDAIGKRS
jgi:2-oxoglutarate dehydrogenase E1 component